MYKYFQTNYTLCYVKDNVCVVGIEVVVYTYLDSTTQLILMKMTKKKIIPRTKILGRF